MGMANEAEAIQHAAVVEEQQKAEALRLLILSKDTAKLNHINEELARKRQQEQKEANREAERRIFLANNLDRSEIPHLLPFYLRTEKDGLKMKYVFQVPGYCVLYLEFHPAHLESIHGKYSIQFRDETGHYSGTYRDLGEALVDAEIEKPIVQTPLN